MVWKSVWNKLNKAVLVWLYIVSIFHMEYTYFYTHLLIFRMLKTVRKEGRALGEVTKYLVYNARKRPIRFHYNRLQVQLA